jgi:Na+-transporting NADH:ubiquinone oxidoreductase subunit NqrD
MRRAAGYAMFAAPFVAFLGALVYAIGVGPMLIVLGVSALLTTWFVCAEELVK